MNRLNSIALLAGGILVAVAATGCASGAKPAAAGPAADSSTAAGAPSSGAPYSGTAGASSSAPAGGSSSAPNAGSSSSAPAAPVSHPVCDNAKLNASLYQDQGQPPTNPVVAVKNTGPTCMINPIPYVWIVKSPTDASDELRPLVPGGTSGSAKLQTFLSGTTLYAALDLDPNAAADTAGYGYLEVTANPTKDSSGKDVQDVRLATTMNVSGPKLGVYANNPSLALKALQYSTTPES